MVGYYKDGKKHGRWKTYDSDREAVYIVFRNGIQVHGRSAEIFLESLQKK